VLFRSMQKYPQVLLNVRVARRFDPMSVPCISEMIAALERRFDGRGRIVLRASGTEPVIRVMVEGYEAGLVKSAARDIAAEVESVAAKGTGTAATGNSQA
jgi:phosphoglucosamine mutase